MKDEIIREIEEAIGYTFKNKKLIIRAFTHKSMYKNQDSYDSYEQLEFLGDSILDFIVAEYLYINYSQYNEGEMTVIRSKLVSRQPLSNIIFNLGNDVSDDKLCCGEGIARYLKFGNGSYTTQLTEKVRSDLFEAIVAAIYLDSGMDEAREFILTHMMSVMNIELDSALGDSKSLLQEYAQKHNLTINYVLVDVSGPDHQKKFSYELYIDGQLMGDGTGPNKKLAQQYAAREAYKKILDKDS